MSFVNDKEPYRFFVMTLRAAFTRGQQNFPPAMRLLLPSLPPSGGSEGIQMFGIVERINAHS